MTDAAAPESALLRWYYSDSAAAVGMSSPYPALALMCQTGIPHGAAFASAEPSESELADAAKQSRCRRALASLWPRDRAVLDAAYSDSRLEWPELLSIAGPLVARVVWLCEPSRRLVRRGMAPGASVADRHQAERVVETAAQLLREATEDFLAAYTDMDTGPRPVRYVSVRWPG